MIGRHGRRNIRPWPVVLVKRQFDGEIVRPSILCVNDERRRGEVERVGAHAVRAKQREQHASDTSSAVTISARAGDADGRGVVRPTRGCRKGA